MSGEQSTVQNAALQDAWHIAKEDCHEDCSKRVIQTGIPITLSH